jgi:hypothetical protein
MLLDRLIGRTSPGHLLVACFPKSGSTYLTKALALATGLPLRHVSAAFGHNEQDILERRLQRLTRRSVIQQHIKGTDNNVALLQSHGVRPVVLVRNIFDTLVSLDDHLRQEDHRAPTGYVHRQCWQMDFEDRLDYLIQVHLPWYFNFFVSWREAADRIQILWMTYERLFDDVPHALAEVLTFHGLSVGHERLTQVADTLRDADTRFNKGVCGRGDDLLSEAHKDAIRRLAAVWQLDTGALALIGLAESTRPAIDYFTGRFA